MKGPDGPIGPPRRRLLVLAGSTEASELIRAIDSEKSGVEVVVSYAGRTATRTSLPKGVAVRVGGFGGIEGLANHLRSDGISAMIDATHPFAARMPFHAAAACRTVGVPLLRIVRPAWAPQPADQWIHVTTVDDAACVVQQLRAGRVLLTIGRQELRAFAGCEATFFARSIDPPETDVLPGATILLARAPFTLDDELDLIRNHRIDLMVSKNAGGDATRAKLDAARQLGIPVIMIARPPAPPVDTVEVAHDALAWIVGHFGARG